MINKKEAIVNMKKAHLTSPEQMRQTKNFIHKYNKLPEHDSAKSHALEGMKRGVHEIGKGHGVMKTAKSEHTKHYNQATHSFED